jgi:Dehydrogenases with different specificities (related to short-chain alcohol dehydrogenases)
MNILVTGASRGVGLALADLLSAKGHLVFAAVRDIGGSKLAALSEKRSNLRPVKMDVSNPYSILEARRTLTESVDVLDIVINNAGVLLPGDRIHPIQSMDIAEFEKTLSVNTVAPVRVLQAFLPLLQKSAAPVFAVITSEGTVEESGQWIPAYSVSKVAANKVVSVMKETLGGQVRCLAIHPGRVNTDMGGATAQIEPEESALGIAALVTGETPAESWYIDYKGRRMPPDRA